MKLIHETDDLALFYGNCLDVLREFPDNTFDACVTDPPYGLGFMNRDWDKKLPGIEIWLEVLRVLKPGAHALVLGGTRTYHRLVCSIEDAGFEIRDQLQWLYGSGFPKSHNVALGIDKHFGHDKRGRAIPTASSYQACDVDRQDKLSSNPVSGYTARTPEAEAWNDYGTALKPAYEPICLARVPLAGTVAENVLAWGTGCLNIGACRVPSEESTRRNKQASIGYGGSNTPFQSGSDQGRWPAHILHDGSPEVVELFPDSNGKPNPAYKFSGPPSDNINVGGGQINCQYQDSGSAARFFYCAKASKKEREAGLRGPGVPVLDGRGKTKRLNTCPTVKPIDLMRYLCRLITPKPGGLILEPFTGSGSTLLAARAEGFRAVGIDADAEHIEIARRRLQ